MSRAIRSSHIKEREQCNVASLGLLAVLLLMSGGCRKANEATSPSDINLRYLVYTEDGTIRRISEDGTVTQDLTLASEAGRNPRCSPDGSWIAYYASPDSTSEPVGVWIMHPDGTSKTRLTDVAIQGADFLENLQWSADSKAIFYESPKAGSHQVYSVSPIAGSTALKLTDAEFAVRPIPSPTNTLLAYRGSHQGIVAEYILDLKTGNPPRRLISTGEMGAPRWSPDGERLCFGANFDSVATIDRLDLYTCRVDGSALTRLTNDGASVAREWSPDGRRILYVSNGSGSWSLCLMNADGSARTIVVTTPSAIFDAHFSPDGLRLAYLVVEPASKVHVELYTVNVDGTGAKKIASRCASDVSWCR
jgi:Tol biopolymer transport system component